MYSKLEVVQMLVRANNMIMELVDSKVFVIDYANEEVVCYRKRTFLPDKELSRYSFDFIIEEVGGKIK